MITVPTSLDVDTINSWKTQTGNDIHKQQQI